MRSTFLALAIFARAAAEDSAQALAPLTEQDPKGAACGGYFRTDEGKIIYHIRGQDKSNSQPLTFIAKIVVDDKAAVPAILSRPIAEGALLTIIVSSAQKKEASCLPADVYVEKKQ